MIFPSALVRRGVSVGFLLLVLAGTQLLAQNRSLLDLYRDRSRVVPRNSISRMSAEAQQLRDASTSAALLAPLEGAVSDSTYIVGPNDQFTISIGGMDPIVSPTVVSSDGVLVLPGLGRVQAAGRTLGEVKADALGRLQAGFRNVTVDLALSKPREFYVHVAGAVPEPGRYVAMPVARVEDVLKQAFFSTTLAAPTGSERFRPALRNVTVRRADGTEVSLDLVRYYRTGEVKWNPFVLDGDAIQVPPFEASVNAVVVDGDIAFPGVYDYRPGDTVYDLLLIGTGDTRMDDDVVIQHTRPTRTGSSESSVYTVRELRNGPPIPVQALDHVHVPMANPTSGLASVEGWVQFPGRYPVVAGETTLADLVRMAGGLRDGALLRAAYLERGAELVPERRDVLAELERYEIRQGAQQGVGRFDILTDSSSTLWNMRLGEFGYMSRYFLARWLRMDNRVSADIEAGLTSDDRPVYLEDGDRLVIPRDENAVFVIGEVVRPGRVTFSPGARSSDYVTMAGGSGPRASRTYVIRAGVGQVLPGSEPVYSGDYVFVDRSDGESASVEAERVRIQLEGQGIQRYQVALQTVGTILSIVTTALLVENALSRN